MRLANLLLAFFSFAIGLSILYYALNITCPRYGFVFEQVNASCSGFFLVVCTGMLLVGLYFMIAYMAGDFRRIKYSRP